MVKSPAWPKRLFNTATTPPADRYASTFGIFVAGVAFIVFGLAFFSALISLWPAVASAGANTGAKHAVTLVWGLYTLHVGKTTGLLLLALLMGAIGGYIHAATSFVSYIGNRQFKASWGWWYALRAFIGAALALLFYLALRAGFVSTGASTAGINSYGVAAMSGLAGLFSKQATDKLEEVFNTAFRTSSGIGDHQREDSMAAGAPTIEKLTPASVPAGQAALILIQGAGFVNGDCSTGQRRTAAVQRFCLAGLD